MAGAYTPGLTVTGDIVVRRIRRLPIKGEVLVKVGDRVAPTTPVARALLPGPLQTLKLAEKLDVEPREAPAVSMIPPGGTIEVGQVVAERKGFFGRKQQVLSDCSGTVESISSVTGNMLIREAPIPVEISAYIQGSVVETMDGEGAVVETRCAMVQGIFGVGGERHGEIRIAVKDPKEPLDADAIQTTDAGKILIGGSGITAAALKRASELGVTGMVAGGIRDADLIAYLGYDIGVAITGQEDIPLTVVVTEGFGFLSMAHHTFKLFQSLDGLDASINGATQIRAGVIRPEVIAPLSADAPKLAASKSSFELEIGTPIRIIREPYFGELGVVTELPAQLVKVESGTDVRVLKAKLDDSREAIVPRANVEILAN